MLLWAVLLCVSLPYHSRLKFASTRVAADEALSITVNALTGPLQSGGKATLQSRGFESVKKSTWAVFFQKHGLSVPSLLFTAGLES
jgi:hypothetical protein